MLYRVLKEIRNFFVVANQRIEGTFSITDGNIVSDEALPFADGQYVLIEGSIFNDGVFRYNEEPLKDETFDGALIGLAIPQELLDLIPEIEKFQKTMDEAGPYQSESFGGYSYTLRSDANDWKKAYASQLNAWRKL